MISADDERLLDSFREAVKHLSAKRVARETGLAVGTAHRLKQENPSRLSTDVRLKLLAYMKGSANGVKVPRETESLAEGSPIRDSLGAPDRLEFDYIVAQFQNTEGMRRFAGHITANGRLAGALDYAEERGASEAVIDALHEWGKAEARREKNRS